jgi:hypothetical protein
MIVRKQFRGCLKSGIDQDSFLLSTAEVNERARDLVKKNVLWNASAFIHGNMIFLYEEAAEGFETPGNFLKPLEQYLKPWPEADGDCFFAPMYPVYYHDRADDPEDWEKNRTGKKRIGRIAFLKPEKLTSYVYWHTAIVKEGLFKGDKYQFISIHENVLFSYFEEPKTMVNILKSEEKSCIIDQWTEQLPAAHFCRERTGGSNFLIIDTLFSVGRSELG